MKVLFEELDVSKNFSNSSKTEGMCIGSLKGSDEKPYGTKWPNEPIKELEGIKIGYQDTKLFQYGMEKIK